MLYKKSKKGYFYKIYKNGKKKRISKKEYIKSKNLKLKVGGGTTCKCMMTPEQQQYELKKNHYKQMIEYLYRTYPSNAKKYLDKFPSEDLELNQTTFNAFYDEIYQYYIESEMMGYNPFTNIDRNKIIKAKEMYKKLKLSYMVGKIEFLNKIAEKCRELNISFNDLNDLKTKSEHEILEILKTKNDDEISKIIEKILNKEKKREKCKYLRINFNSSNNEINNALVRKRKELNLNSDATYEACQNKEQETYEIDSNTGKFQIIKEIARTNKSFVYTPSLEVYKHGLYPNYQRVMKISNNVNRNIEGQNKIKKILSSTRDVHYEDYFVESILYEYNFRRNEKTSSVFKKREKYLTMEKGISLHDILLNPNKHNSITLQQFAKAFLHLLNGLKILINHGIMLFDLKPKNIVYVDGKFKHIDTDSSFIVTNIAEFYNFIYKQLLFFEYNILTFYYWSTTFYMIAILFRWFSNINITENKVNRKEEYLSLLTECIYAGYYRKGNEDFDYIKSDLPFSNPLEDPDIYTMLHIYYYLKVPYSISLKKGRVCITEQQKHIIKSFHYYFNNYLNITQERTDENEFTKEELLTLLKSYSIDNLSSTIEDPTLEDFNIMGVQDIPRFKPKVTKADSHKEKQLLSISREIDKNHPIFPTGEIFRCKENLNPRMYDTPIWKYLNISVLPPFKPLLCNLKEPTPNEEHTPNEIWKKLVTDLTIGQLVHLKMELPPKSFKDKEISSKFFKFLDVCKANESVYNIDNVISEFSETFKTEFSETFKTELSETFKTELSETF